MSDTGTRCHRRRCGRELTAPASVGAGYGPACEARVRETVKAVAATYSLAQIGRALQLVASGQMTPVDGGWLVPSSDGLRSYLATASTCNCRAGRHGVPCWHCAAVMLADA